MRIILRPGSIHDRARPGAHLIPFETKLLGREDLAGPGRHCRSTPAICQALPNRQGPCPALHAAIMARPRFDRAQEGLSSLLSMSLEPDFHRLWPNVDLERIDPVLVELRVIAVDDPCAIPVDRHVRTRKGKEMDG
jgi:hypothetical protein